MKRFEAKIEGMHCASCEVLIERKLKKISGVEKVSVNNASGKAEIYSSRNLNASELNDAIKGDNYRVSSLIEKMDSKEERHVSEASDKIQSNNLNDYIEIGAIFIAFFGLYLFLKQFSLLPDNIGISDNMSYLFVFGIGLVAAMSTCLAVTGGLLLGVAAKHSEKNPSLTGYQRLKPHFYFNVGRVASYTLLGGLVGLLGSILIISPKINGVLVFFVSAIMILLGIQMLNIFPWASKFQPIMPKFFAHKVYESNENTKKAAPFLFGASTFFFPCGFTQALQLYVLSTGSFTVGALTMAAFSLGTLPSLLSIGAITSFSKGEFKSYFIKFAGVLVIMLGFISLNNGLVLAGGGLSIAAPDNQDAAVGALIAGGVQIVEMKVNGYDYLPDTFKIKKGVPVEWRIDGRQARGCAQIISIPNLGIVERLNTNEITTINFTPQREGRLLFTCGMGMTGPGYFIVE